MLKVPILSDTVVRTDSSPGANTPHVFVVADAAAMASVIEHAPPDARYFAGFVGWEEGELDAGIEQGLWSVLDANADIILRRGPTSLWKELSRGRPGE